jgi:hypothetical protein
MQPVGFLSALFFAVVWTANALVQACTDVNAQRKLTFILCVLLSKRK